MGQTSQLPTTYVHYVAVIWIWNTLDGPHRIHLLAREQMRTHLTREITGKLLPQLTDKFSM